MKIRATKKTKKKKKAATPKPKKQGGGGRKRAAAPVAAPDFHDDDDDVETTTPPPKKKRGRPAGSKNKKKKVQEEEEEVLEPVPVAKEEDPPPQNDIALDEGDPPWRTTGHENLSRKVCWTPPLDNEMGVASQPCIGTVVAWIAETDVDSDGNPGFLCSRTGNPARLFHAIFEEFEQDFEEWELEECFVDEE